MPPAPWAPAPILPVLPLAALAGLSVDGFWSKEPQVNAVWLALLTQAFPGGGATPYIVAPEGRAVAGESLQRADLLVSQLTPGAGGAWVTATITNILHFEGKSGTAADASFDDVRAQIRDWMSHRGPFLPNTLSFSIGAKGRRWLAFVYNANDHGVQFLRFRQNAAGTYVVSSRTTNVQPSLDLATDLPILRDFLAVVAANPNPRPGSIDVL